MSLFKGDPASALAKTKQRIADVVANIETLKARRQELLALSDDDNVVEIQRATKAIEAEEANRAIYEAKARALVEEARKVTYQEREGQRTRAINKITAEPARGASRPAPGDHRASRDALRATDYA
jgi:hypothetical protein